MYRLPLRKIDLLVLSEFIPFFLIGVVAFSMLMVAVTLLRDMVKYIADFGLSPAQVCVFGALALPQTVAYTFPMAVLFSGLLSFGRLSESNQITALRAGGIGFMRILLPALAFAWFVVLGTFILNEKVAPQSTRAAKEYIHNALVERGITVQASDISYMDQDAGWLFAAATSEGNVFHDVRWWDFSREDFITFYTAEEGVWQSGGWVFHNATVVHLNVANGYARGDGGEDRSAGPTNNGNVIRSMFSPTLEMQISATPSDILTERNRDPQEMSLQELRSYLATLTTGKHSEQFMRRIEGTYHLKIAAPFASIVFILIAAPLGLAPQRSTGTMGIGFSMVLVFIYYLLTTFSVKIAEGGVLVPFAAAWLPNAIFLVAGAILNGRFYIRST